MCLLAPLQFALLKRHPNHVVCMWSQGLQYRLGCSADWATQQDHLWAVRNVAGPRIKGRHEGCNRTMRWPWDDHWSGRCWGLMTTCGSTNDWTFVHVKSQQLELVNILIKCPSGAIQGCWVQDDLHKPCSRLSWSSQLQFASKQGLLCTCDLSKLAWCPD